MRVHAGVQALLYVVGEGIGCHSDNGNRLPKRIGAVADGPCSLVSVHDRHLDIHENQIVIAGTGGSEGIAEFLSVWIDIAGDMPQLQNGLEDFRI